MGRYTGPEHRIWRRLGVDDAPEWLRGKIARDTPPGAHGGGRFRGGKQSEYAKQLLEKQKLRMYYGVLEKQFRRYVARAQRLPGETGHNLFRLLETRLDAVVFRLGLAPSMRAARQFVNHGHVQVNGKRCDIASREVKVGDIVQVQPQSRNLEIVQLALASRSNVVPDYLAMDPASMAGELLHLPERHEIASGVQERLVVEFYARRNVRG
ncbi:MAG TPA: 30S ribosomal protein S4 [Armatimonadetes bacterium]|nr:30S ribosomal protein S4 [Armatimonadota bacterium]